MLSFLVPIEIETEIKNILELKNALHFVDLQNVRAGAGHLSSLYYRIESTMSFFRNTAVPLLISRTRSAHALLRSGNYKCGHFC